MAEKHVVYGGSGGIGGAVAERLRARGADLVLVGRDGERLSAAASRLGAAFVAGDVGEAATHAAVAEAVGEGPLAGLVYAVGTINLKPFHRLTDEDFLADWQVNLLGAVRAVRALARPLAAAEGGGSVVLFSSVAARQGFPAHASIGSAKGAVEGLVVSLAAELAPKVRVNAVAPSLTRTPLAAQMTGSETMAKAIAGMHPLGRLGEPDDIAAVADLLLGPGGTWITGQVFGVDGGRATLRVKG